jgi:hypothetical protein
VCYSPVPVREIVLVQENVFIRVAKAQHNNKVDDAEKTPYIYHLGVLSHIDMVVDQDAFLHQQLRQVLSESLFELASSGGCQGVLAHDSAALHEGFLDFVDQVRAERIRDKHLCPGAVGLYPHWHLWTCDFLALRWLGAWPPSALWSAGT